MGRIGNRLDYYERLDQTFSFSYKESVGSGNKHAHIHDQYELLLCLSDDMLCDVDGTVYPVGKNTLCLFNNMDLHHLRTRDPQGENKRFVVYFQPFYIEFLSTNDVNLLDCFLFRPFDDSQILPLQEDEVERIEVIMRELMRYQDMTREDCYGRELHIQLLLAQLLLEVNTWYRNYHHINNDSASENYRVIYRMINYINIHYMDDLSLDFLSHKFYINKYALCEDFRKVAGMTPNKYIVNCRITKAKELLQRGDQVDQVCSEIGFNNLSHFSRSFKNAIGLSPKQYQQSLKAGRLLYG